MNALVTDPTTWTDVGAVTDIPLRGARRVPTPRGAVAIFRTGDGQVFALRDACPHKGGPLTRSCTASGGLPAAQLVDQAGRARREPTQQGLRATVPLRFRTAACSWAAEVAASAPPAHIAVSVRRRCGRKAGR